ncbi:MAG: carboxypeptidase-like regulatory domain-containing protein, partial [Calditrichaeota bacterium]|nr:carboxypeptidase-like regulatory domain-containing protein [Calditrichota bacterium]
MIKRIHLIILIVMFTVIQGNAIAENIAIRGFVTDATSGEPLLVASVIIEGTERGASTNLDGYFIINYVERGSYNLIASYLGYENTIVPIVVMDDRMEPLHIELQPASVKLEVAEVILKKSEFSDTRKRARVSTVPITANVIRTMPSLGGEMD